jgi:hypothetical protein
MAALAVVAALIPAGVASAAPIGGLTAVGAKATSLQRSGGPITTPVVGTASTGVPLDVFPTGGKGSGTEYVCESFNDWLNEDLVKVDNAIANNHMTEYLDAKAQFDQDYNDALDSGCAVID